MSEPIEKLLDFQLIKERLTPEEVLKKYNDYLSETEKRILNELQEKKENKDAR